MKKQRYVTIRSVFCVLAFFSGFVLLAFWLSAPDLKERPEEEIGSDLDAHRMTTDSNPEIAAKVQMALADLQDLQTESEVDPIMTKHDRPDHPGDTASVEGPAEVVEAEEQKTLLQKRLAALEEQRGGERLEALNQLWYFAADHGVPAEALEALYELTLDPDPAIAQAAHAALEDLERLQEVSEAALQGPPEYDNPDDPEDNDLVAEGLETGHPETAERWAALVMDAMYEPDEDRRSDAVNAVVLRRNADVVATLTDVATFDPAPEIRHQTLEALWYAAADGLDADGRIKETLQDALADPDPDIAALAKRALEDLQTLE